MDEYKDCHESEKVGNLGSEQPSLFLYLSCLDALYAKNSSFHNLKTAVL